MAFKINGAYLNARERPGFEIDTRAARKETAVNASFEYSALSKTYIGGLRRDQTRFASDATFLDPETNVKINLSTSLNRIDTTYGIDLRHQLTPLTPTSNFHFFK